MKVRVIASTKIGYELPKEEAVAFSGYEANICYMPEDIDTLLAQPKETAIKRAKRNIKSLHHSVSEHCSYNYIIEDIPKILAMLLNNQQVYATSEKSGRYTKMKASEREEAIYNKWIKLLEQEIDKVYPQFVEEKTGDRAEKINKLAMENARYMISAFTPATIMGHTLNFKEINYHVASFKNFIKDAEDTEFNKQLKEWMQKFVDCVKNQTVEGLNNDVKEKYPLFFAPRERKEEWGESYCTSYLATLPHFGQALRHRGIYYDCMLLDEPQFYVPPVLKGTKLEEEWLKDINSLADLFPQGMLVKVFERGTVDKFIYKMKERFCGCAQLEIQEQTRITFKKYLENVKDTNPYVYEELKKYDVDGPRCQFGFKCPKPCVWGGKNAFNRIV